MSKVTKAEKEETFKILASQRPKGGRRVRTIGDRGTANHRVLHVRNEGGYEISYHVTKGFRKVRAAYSSPLPAA